MYVDLQCVAEDDVDGTISVRNFAVEMWVFGWRELLVLFSIAGKSLCSEQNNLPPLSDGLH